MITLYYVHDPMCSWCWAFRPTLAHLRKALPGNIRFQQLLGGLAPDNDQPMADEMRQQIEATWRRIQQRLPETEFNFDFWVNNQPRRSTYPACRAVIAARLLDPAQEAGMIFGIQKAYYLYAKNPSDDAILIEIARSLGLDSMRFQQLLDAPETHRHLDNEIQQSRALGVRSFPSLLLQQGKSAWQVPVDYTSADSMLATIDLLLD